MFLALDKDAVLKTATGLNSSVEDLEVEGSKDSRVILAYWPLPTSNFKDWYLRCLRDLRQKGEVPPDEAVTKWASQGIDGLGYIHYEDMSQADIECHSVFIDKKDDLKLRDFDEEKSASTPYFSRSRCYPGRVRSR